MIVVDVGDRHLVVSLVYYVVVCRVVTLAWRGVNGQRIRALVIQQL